MTTNNNIDLRDLKASVGWEMCTGLINDLGGINEMIMDMWTEDEEMAACYSESQAAITTWQAGVEEVLSYAEEHGASPKEMHEVVSLCETLKTQAETSGDKVTWIVWGIETDVCLGYTLN